MNNASVVHKSMGRFFSCKTGIQDGTLSGCCWLNQKEARLCQFIGTGEYIWTGSGRMYVAFCCLESRPCIVAPAGVGTDQ